MMDYAGRVAKADTYPKLLRLNAKEHGGEIALREKDFGLWRLFTWNDYQTRVRDFAAILFGVEAQQFRIGIGLGDASGVIHHAAVSAGVGVSSGSTRTSSSSPR